MRLFGRLQVIMPFVAAVFYLTPILFSLLFMTTNFAAASMCYFLIITFWRMMNILNRFLGEYSLMIKDFVTCIISLSKEERLNERYKVLKNLENSFFWLHGFEILRKLRFWLPVCMLMTAIINVSTLMMVVVDLMAAIRFYYELTSTPLITANTKLLFITFYKLFFYAWNAEFWDPHDLGKI